jgi:hypothetical protein
MNRLIRSGQHVQTLAVNVAVSDPVRTFCRIRIRIILGLKIQIRIQTKNQMYLQFSEICLFPRNIGLSRIMTHMAYDAGEKKIATVNQWGLTLM